MESIIKAMKGIIAGLEYLREATAGETRETAVHTLELAEMVRDQLQGIIATPQETAAVVADSINKVFGGPLTDDPVEE